MKKLVVSDNSVITSNEYNKITVTSKNIEIYTYSGKKYNKSTYSFE